MTDATPHINRIVSVNVHEFLESFKDEDHGYEGSETLFGETSDVTYEGAHIERSHQ